MLVDVWTCTVLYNYTVLYHCPAQLLTSGGVELLACYVGRPVVIFSFLLAGFGYAYLLAFVWLIYQHFKLRAPSVVGLARSKFGAK
jgi:hypothetical protein